MDAPKGNVAKPGGAEPRGLLFLSGGQKTGANGIGKENEQPKSQSKGTALRGGRHKRDVLGNAGGNVGGWDHSIDSSYDYVDTMFKEEAANGTRVCSAYEAKAFCLLVRQFGDGPYRASAPSILNINCTWSRCGFWFNTAKQLGCDCDGTETRGCGPLGIGRSYQCCPTCLINGNK
uniref:Uncharacterized protein n=1 Tax=Globodera rostochiensis TaxID=31243 RepID=A0A914IFD5_GLORO